MEIWKDVLGYEGLYQISNKGFIYSCVSDKILKNHIGTTGYYFVNLYKDKTALNHRVHKLVAINFLNHIANGFEEVIDHIDNDKLNNDVSNLQITTNRINSCKDRKSKSGHYNIYKNNSAWIVRMRVDGIKKTFGTFKNIDDAINKRDLVLSFIDNKSKNRKQDKTLNLFHQL